MEPRDTTRRTFLRAGAAAVTAGALAGQASAADPFDGWLSNTSNFEGLTDRTGQETVTITVGVDGNGGPNAFGPPAVRVDPGTTVVWEWSGDGYHNVTAADGSFESEMTDQAGHSFERTFEESGVVKYACGPHQMMGMKGVVVVGDVDVGVGEAGGDGTAAGPDYGDWFENVSNFESTVDATGQDEVRIAVGARGNNGNYAFDPPAVRVDPGTTVVWEWTGKGGTHNVVAADGSFGTDLIGESGHTFSTTFESGGIHRYACKPHEMMGMKGAVVVDGPTQAGLDSSELLTLGGGVGLAAGVFGLFVTGLREHARPAEKK